MGSCVDIIMIMMLLIMSDFLSDNFSSIIYQLTLAPSSITLSCSPAPRSTMVAMLSNGFPLVRPPFLSPIT